MARQVVSLSGGRDSTCMLLMMLERGEQIDDIVFFDWGKEYPEMYEHLEKLEVYIARPISRLYPLHSWEWYRDDYIRVKGAWKGVQGYGIPTGKSKWCTRIKMNAIKKYCGRVIECIGYAFEERRRARYKPWHRYPLLEWGVTSYEALKYCEAHGFDWGGLYREWARVSCSCCPFRRRLIG